MSHRSPRRWFLRTAGLVLAAPLPAAIASLVNRFNATLPRLRTIVVPGNTGDAVTFADGVIVTRSTGTVRAFSAKCTHLGCLIDRSEGDLLICPCHGSRFRLDGTVAAGPAIRPLEPLEHETDPTTGDVTVRAS
jgi:Rieske Fe-S protein